MGNKLKWLMRCSSPRYSVKAISVKSFDGDGRWSYGQNMVPSLTLWITSTCRAVEGDFMFQRDKMLVMLLNMTR